MSLEQFKDVDLTEMTKEQLFLYQKTLETELSKVNDQYHLLKTITITYEDIVKKIKNLSSENFTVDKPFELHFKKLIEDGYFYVKFYRYPSYKSIKPVEGYLKIVGTKDQNGVITDIITDTLLIEMPKQLVIHNTKRLVTQSKLSKDYTTFDQPTLVLETTLGGFIKPDELKDIIDTVVNDTTITYQ